MAKKSISVDRVESLVVWLRDVCPKCNGSGSNKSLPKMTRGMWHACERCRGSGWDIKRIGVGPHETVKLMPPCKSKETP